jgi:hypothetical protein
MTNSDHDSKIAEDLMEIINEVLTMNKPLQTVDQNCIDPSSVTHVRLRHYVSYRRHSSFLVAPELKIL